MKKILWIGRHDMKDIQRKQLEEYFDDEIEVKIYKLNLHRAEDAIQLAQDCDAIMAVLPPEKMQKLVCLNKKSGEKLILKAKGEHIPSGTLDFRTGKEIKQFEHHYFEVIEDYIYDVEKLSGTQVCDVKSILVVSQYSLTDLQKTDLREVFGTDVQIDEQKIQIENVAAFLQICEQYDAIAPFVTPELREQIVPFSKKINITSESERRKDSSEYKHKYWVRINRWEIKSKKLLKEI